MSSVPQVLHISNISPFATKEQIQMLFSYVGRIEEFKLYPSDLSLMQNTQQPKFAYVKFEDERGVEVGQHLTNTVFLDRALVCIPAQTNTIPDEETALQSGITALPGQRQLPPHISNQLQDMGEGQQMIVTVDPNLAALGLPAYPPLPPTTEPAKVEEIRRTIYVGNLPKGCDGEELVNFINACIGEVMYIRMAAGNDYLPCDYAYIEFSQQSSVPLALQNSDTLEFQGHPLRIQHSKVAIIKPQRKTADEALEEVEQAIKSGNDGRMADVGRGYSPVRPGQVPAALAVKALASASPRTSVKRSRSRSSSRGRRSRSRHRSRRRSRSRSSSRSRSPSRSQRRRSRSRSRSRRRSRDRKRSRSRRRSRSRDKDRKKSSKRSRSRERSSKDGGGKTSKRDRDRSKEKSSKKDREKEKEREREKDREKEKEKKERKRSRSREKKDKRDKDKDREKDKEEKKSKRSGEGSTPKKAKREPHTPPSPSTRTNASDTPSTTTTTPMDTLTTETSERQQVKKEKTEAEEEPRPAPPPAEEAGEERELRERLLERVKLKQQRSSED